MNAQVFLTHADVKPEALVEKSAVVIDVLRASTSIATAFQNGASTIIPVAEVDAARKLITGQSRATTMLCGERDGSRLPGFDLGNSPAEYTAEKVQHKTLIFTSTNGAQALAKTRLAQYTVISAFVNVGVTVDFLIQAEADVAICCAGTNGAFSLDDAVCGGLILSKLYAKLSDKLILDDMGTALLILGRRFENSILNMLRLSTHGRKLMKLGFGSDLILCANSDSVPVLPRLKNGIITRFGQ